MDSLKQFFRGKWWLILTYILLVLAPVLAERIGEFLGASECENIPLTVKLFHQRLCTIGYFKPRVHFTRLVTLSEGSEPVQDKCEGREFMAKVLLRLSEIGPALVVIDKWYPSDICKDSPGTIDLKSAIVRLSEKAPVVLGEGSYTLDELRANAYPKLEDLVKNGFTE